MVVAAAIAAVVLAVVVAIISAELVNWAVPEQVPGIYRLCSSN